MRSHPRESGDPVPLAAGLFATLRQNQYSKPEADSHTAAAATAAASHADAENGRIAAEASLRGPQMELFGGDNRVDIVRLANPSGAGAGYRSDHGDLPARGIAGRFQVAAPLEDKASLRRAIGFRPPVGVERVGQHLDLRAVLQVGSTHDRAAPLHALARGRLRVGGDLLWGQQGIDIEGIEGRPAGAGGQQEQENR